MYLFRVKAPDQSEGPWDYYETVATIPGDQADRPVDLVDRNFTAPAPNALWVADFTYIWTSEGWLYFAVVLDLFSRRIVGWSMSREMTSQLVTDALIMAIWRRGKPQELLHHSDQGSQGGFNRPSQHCVVERILELR